MSSSSYHLHLIFFNANIFHVQILAVYWHENGIAHVEYERENASVFS